MDEAVLEVLASKGNANMLNFALRKWGVGKIPSRVYVAAASNNRFGYPIVRHFRKSLEAEEVDTVRGMIKAAAANREQGLDILGILLSISNTSIRLDEEDLRIAASNETQGRKILELLSTRSALPTITRVVLVAGAENRCSGEAVVAFLLAKLNHLELTEDLVRAAARNNVCGKQVLDLLLAKADKWPNPATTEPALEDTAESTSELITSAACDEFLGRQLLDDLLKDLEYTVEINEAIVKAALGNRNFKRSLMQLLLADSGKTPITEDLICKASSNRACSQAVLRIMLESAAENGHELVPQLIDSIKKDAYGVRDALNYAAYRGNLAAMRVLLRNGANINKQAEGIGNALHIAAFRGRLEAVELLLRHGIDVNAPGGPHSTALLAACHQADAKVARSLVKAGADVESPTWLGRTVLHFCLKGHQIQASECLLAVGASDSLVDEQHRAALHHAAAAGFTHGVEILLDAGVPVSDPDSAGWTPLHWAAVRAVDIQWNCY